MEHSSNLLFTLLRTALAAAVLIVPAWWAAGRLQDEKTVPFFRFLVSLGFALVGYVAFVNLLGRLTGNSIVAVLIYLLANATGSAFLLWRRPPAEFKPIGLLSTWRAWAGPVLLACVLGLPQWFVAVSTNYWDEAASSAIHLTAPNQFAEGVFPPRHNALPGIGVKYHYAFAILSGTVKWLLGVSANNAVDIVSTALWLFIFLFILFWLRKLEFDRLTAAWGAFSVLLGGGLAWLYLPNIEAYGGVEKVPGPADLLHRWDAAKSWLANLRGTGQVPSLHLRNADGSLSNLPWDIAAQFQQHAVSLGIATTLVALYLFTTWQKRADLRRPLLAANVVAFSVNFLGHAVFGTVAAAAAGTCLLLSWVRHAFFSERGDEGSRRTRRQKGESQIRRERARAAFLDGLFFVPGVAIVAFLHGGMLARGAEYGGGVGFTTWRREFGYSAGGLAGFLNWNIAGFGLPLVLAILAWCLHRRRRDPAAVERNILFTALTIFGVFSYFVPQLMFYSSETYGVETFTEISKFFFSDHFALALLSTFGVAYLGRLRQWPVVAACFLAAAITPVAFCYVNSVDPKGSWLGFYWAPYFRGSIEEQMGKALGRLKKTSHDVYFDASADERHHNYLSEMLVFGGSVFTMTPSRFERTGVGFRLSEDVVARRYVQNSRLARLLPGAAEQAGCGWYYSRPFSDFAIAPVIVRSRFGKLVADGSFAPKFTAGVRALYAIEKPTADLDRDIEHYWSPNLVTPAHADCDGEGKGGLVFFDYVAKKILCGKAAIDLPEWAGGEFVNLYVARFPGEAKADFLVGRMKDTLFRLGKRIEEVVEVDNWAWSYRGSKGGWQPEYERWYWDMDIPFIADLEHSGFDSHFAYRLGTGEWLLAPNQTLPGPKVGKDLLPVPFGGRFLAGSKGDLGVWTILNGTVTLRTVATGKSVSFRWGGTNGFILVPGDYDGDGYDEVGVYNRNDFTWYWRHAPDGPISQATFGTKTGIPVPYDYNHDGHLDLAYWEPGEGKIYVSYNLGRTVDLVVPVPPHSIPAFVNMY